MTVTRAPATLTIGRLIVSVSAPTGSVRVRSHADAPRGRRQKCGGAPRSLPFHTMYAVPTGSTATPGSAPAPTTVNGAAYALVDPTSSATTVVKTVRMGRTLSEAPAARNRDHC